MRPEIALRVTLQDISTSVGHPSGSRRAMLDFAVRAMRVVAGKSADEIAGDELLSMALPRMLE
jgi:hypothetical protein